MLSGRWTRYQSGEGSRARLVTDADPLGPMMVGWGRFAVLNLVCVAHGSGFTTNDVNIRAATTFSANDAVSSIGILVAGALVAWIG